MTKLYTLPALMIVLPPRSPHPPKVNRQDRRMRSMALAAANELPQRTCTAAALDRQICRSLLVTPPKEILLRPTPSFANIKRRTLFKVYYQRPTKPPTPQEAPSNCDTEEPVSRRTRSQVTLPNAPIISVTPPTKNQCDAPH